MERLTTRDLAARTHLSPQTILNYVKDGKIEPIDITPDGKFYFNMSVADALITRNLLKKYPNHTAVVVLYVDEDRMKRFENIYNKSLETAGILRVDNLVEKVAEVRERIEGNSSRDKIFNIYIYFEIMEKYLNEKKRLEDNVPVQIMKNPKLKDRTFLLENLATLVTNPKPVLEKLDADDRKIVGHALGCCKEQTAQLYERYTMDEVRAFGKKLDSILEKTNTEVQELKTKGEICNFGNKYKAMIEENDLDFQVKTKAVADLVRKAKQSFYTDSLDRALDVLKKGYVSIIKINCTMKDNIYDLLYQTRYTENIKLYGYSNATEELGEVIRFLEGTKKLEYGDMEV